MTAGRIVLDEDVVDEALRAMGEEIAEVQQQLQTHFDEEEVRSRKQRVLPDWQPVPGLNVAATEAFGTPPEMRLPVARATWARLLLSAWADTESKRLARQVSNSVLIASQTRETVDLLNAASAPSASAKVASTSRTDRPRTNPAITSDSNAWVRVTFCPNNREANRSVVPRSFGRAIVTGPAVVLIVVGQ